MQTSLLSPGFLGIALVAIVLLPMLRGSPREIAFLMLNLLFIGALVLGPLGALSTLLFTLLGYALVLLAARARLGGLIAGIIVLVALFIFMRRYEFLEWFLPTEWLPRVLSTIGLSFLFFRVVHTMIDAHGGTLGRVRMLAYVNYCLSFTTFLMGPIQRYQDYREQWNGERLAIPMEWEAHLDAVLRILVGLAKVLVLGVFFETHALRADTVIHDLTVAGLIVQVYSFWLFLYLNFSGYCDVVIGIGSLLGVRPPENFDKPFLARNISDFWQRQHRSLTLWLSDYVFTPLYKALLTSPRTARHKLLAANLSLMATMLVSGLWHGTTFSFLLFGLVHGLWFVIYRSWDELLTSRLTRRGVQKLRAHPLAYAGGVLLTFNATAFSFVFFRLSSEQAMQAFSQLLPW
ncbi:MAG: MBOAT family O-acyltransferase [Gemmatimonadaceae bacterium]